MSSDSVLTEYGLDAFSAILHETAIEKGFWPHEIDTNIVCTMRPGDPGFEECEACQ